tara:strand:+ start:856 stop:1026 length:171 start_codon:yes stop_codon:yes gene_type:complete
MAIKYKNKTKKEILDIILDVCHNRAYAECGICGLLVVEENQNDGDVYTEMANHTCE